MSSEHKLNLRQLYSKNFLSSCEILPLLFQVLELWQSQFLICFWHTIVFFLSSSFTLSLSSSFLPPSCLPTLLFTSFYQCSECIYSPSLFGVQGKCSEYLRVVLGLLGEKGKEGYRKEFLIYFTRNKVLGVTLPRWQHRFLTWLFLTR